MAVVKKVFATDGYDKSNIEIICKKAGIGGGTIRQYFKNKESIFAVILEQEFEEVNLKRLDGYNFVGPLFCDREEIVNACVASVERILALMPRDGDFPRSALEMHRCEQAIHTDPPG